MPLASLLQTYSHAFYSVGDNWSNRSYSAIHRPNSTMAKLTINLCDIAPSHHAYKHLKTLGLYNNLIPNLIKKRTFPFHLK